MKINYKRTTHLPEALIIIFSLVIVFFFPVLAFNKTFFAFDCLFEYFPWKSINSAFRSHNPLITDPVNAYYPPLFYSTHYYFQQHFQINDIPFWFNLNFSGLPFFPYGNPLPFILYTLFPLSIAHDLLLFISITGCGAFTFLYLREIRLSFWASIFGAITWMFNGYVMVWFEFEHIPMMALGLSASLFSIERWFNKRNLLSLMGIIVSFGFCLTISYAHVLIYQFIFFTCYIIFRFIKNIYDSNEKPANKNMHISIILACILSGIIGAHFLTSNIYLYQNNQRTGMDTKVLFDNTGKVLPKYLTTSIFPDFFGSPTKKLNFIPRSSFNQSYNNYNELCLYSGIITLFLTFISLLFIRKSPYIVFFLLFALTCLTSSMGSPIYSPLARWIPGLNLSSPTRILFLYGFSICMMASFGFHFLLKDKHNGSIFICLLILTVCFFLASFVQTHYGLRWATSVNNLNMLPNSIYQMVIDHFHWKSMIIALPIIFSILSFVLLFLLINTDSVTIKTIVCTLIILLVSFDLMHFGYSYNTKASRNSEFPETPAIRFLKNDKELYRTMAIGNFIHHALVPFGIEDIAGYGSFYPKRYGKYLFVSQNTNISNIPKEFSRWIIFQHPNSPLIDLLNVKYVLTEPNIKLNNPNHKKVFSGKINIYENKSTFPRAFCVSSFEAIKNENEIIKRIKNWEASDFKEKVILENLPEIIWPLTPSEKTFTESKIDILQYHPNTIKLTVNTPQNCLLIFNDSYHPGWKAFVDDKPEKVYCANYIMRAVYVPKGKHTIVFQFKPKILLVGFYITLSGWLIAGLIMLFLFLKKERKQSQYKYY